MSARRTPEQQAWLREQQLAERERLVRVVELAQATIARLEAMLAGEAPPEDAQQFTIFAEGRQ